jgi:hypothetical protein
MSLLSFAIPIHRKLRETKLRRFFDECTVEPGHTLLDVGGGAGFNAQYQRLHIFFRSVTIVNLYPPDSVMLPGMRWVLGDGCKLPFTDRSFDWVFSNAVLEHVGSWERQVAIANEIRRVARRGYFIATPNRNFPIDPHTFLPFYHFLPEPYQRRVVRFAPGHLRKYEPLDMLSSKQLLQLFPEAKVFHTGLRTSVVACLMSQPSPVG